MKTIKYSAVAVLLLLFCCTVQAQDSTVSKTIQDTSLIKSDSSASVSKDTTSTIPTDTIKAVEKDTAKTAQEDSSIITVPAGTNLLIALNRSLSTSDASGTTFTGTLERDLTAEGHVVAPAGTLVNGKINYSKKGSRLTFTFVSLNINNESTPIVTEEGGVEGGSDNTARLVGNVTFSGGPFGGATSGNGAHITGGLAGLKTGSNHIQIPAGTIIYIPLRESLIIK